ncbi:MAG TPA: DsbA family protein [Thermoleophilaceae bacterium]|jgi:predicted DsbA family dithiol-disulfide isomerase
MAELCVHIDEFTDPLCPWAWSAEPFRRRLRWLYGEAISWAPRMVVLADEASEQVERGFTPERLSEASKRIAREHRMPIDTAVRDYVPGSGPACRAIVAAREHGEPHEGRALLRELRVHYFRGEQIDRPEVIESAARAARIDPGELDRWIADPATKAALAADRAAAREPKPAARVLDEKLANWSGGRRYTCPSYEITRIEDGVTISVPGFQPFAVYNTILANLVPGLERRELPGDVSEVLDWSAIPISTQEVAVMCDIDFDEARERLGRVARHEPVGADGFWTRA